MAVSAQDPGALCTALKQAMKNDIKVVTYDSDTKPDCRNAFVSQASAEDLGRTEVQLLAKQIGYKGEIAILSAAQTATNQNTWIDFMKDELKKPEYKNIKLVKIAYGNDDAQQSFQQTQGLLQEYPNLKGIISPTTVGIKAAAQYLSGSKYKGKVKLTGLGTPNDMRKYVKNGTVEAFELWDPAKLGELAARTAVAAVLRADHRQGGRDLQGRRHGRVHHRQGRRDQPRQADRVRRQEHRPVQLLITAYDHRGAVLMQRVCFLLKVRAGPARRVPRAARRRVARDAPGALGHRLAQLLALPARGRTARRLPGDRGLRRPPWPAWKPPRSTPAGRRRWRRSSSRWTAPGPTRP